MCVQDIDVQCVLQFTLLHAAGCALHRHASRVIHRSEFCQVHLSQTDCRAATIDADDDRKSTVDTKREMTRRRAGRPAYEHPFFKPSHAPTGHALPDGVRSAIDNRAAPIRVRYPATPQPSNIGAPPERGFHARRTTPRCPYASFESFANDDFRRTSRDTVMILPQVHLRKPCYDFYFL